MQNRIARCCQNLTNILRAKDWPCVPCSQCLGKASWSARAFAVGTLGWYDGNPTLLGTLSSASRAAHMEQLAGGVDKLWAQAQATGDPQWRLELCDHLLALKEPAEELKAKTLEALAEVDINATARNTYFSSAQHLRQIAKSRL